MPYACERSLRSFFCNEMSVLTAIFEKRSVSNLTNMSNFHALEVVYRSSETQLQVGKN